MTKLKLMLALLILIGISSLVVAEDKPIFDLSAFAQQLRIGKAINQFGIESTIFYMPIRTITFNSGVDYININGGYETNPVKNRPLAQIGLRLDNIVGIGDNSSWGKIHVKGIKLPYIEFGPYVSGWPRKEGTKWKLDSFYGLALAIGY